MKRIFIIFLFATFSGYSQEMTTDTNVDNTVYTAGAIETLPEFPGGQVGFAEYISKSYKLPNVKGLSGRVFVDFVVEKDGTLTDIKVIRDLGYGTGPEAIRVLSNSPLWRPGTQDGKPIRVRYSLPLILKVE